MVELVRSDVGAAACPRVVLGDAAGALVTLVPDGPVEVGDVRAAVDELDADGVVVPLVVEDPCEAVRCWAAVAAVEATDVVAADRIASALVRAAGRAGPEVRWPVAGAAVTRVVVVRGFDVGEPASVVTLTSS